MNKSIFVLLAVFAFQACAQDSAGQQQTSANPLSAGSKFMFTIVKTNVTKAAEEMPDGNYSFKPTPDVRSFGQLVGHVADAQYRFCAAVSGDTTPPPNVEKTKTTKADLVQALKDAFAYCDKAYDGMTDAHASDVVKFFGHDAAKLTILDFNSAHTDEHYGNMVSYLRLKGLVPPSSQGRS
ncbi:MAG: DinB family protein [Acidobacteriaceae bacterium]|nr:DinB family protein [Acidobacteriaceae bacterium]